MNFYDHLRQTCQDARVDANMHQVHVAAAGDVDQSAVARFEKRGGPWSPRTGILVYGYASALGMDPSELWLRATLADLEERCEVPRRQRAKAPINAADTCAAITRLLAQP